MQWQIILSFGSINIVQCNKHCLCDNIAKEKYAILILQILVWQYSQFIAVLPNPISNQGNEIL